MEDKRITLAEAAKKVSDGDGLFWGGFGYQRPPIAFSHELVRQKKRNLTVYTCGSEVDLEIMAGAGVVNRYEIAFSAIEALGLSNNIRRRVSEGVLDLEKILGKMNAGDMAYVYIPVELDHAQDVTFGF